MRKVVLLCALVASGAISMASDTIATFSDPAISSSTPLFDWDMTNNTLTASWTMSGLNLQTPGFIGGGSVTDAHFEMLPVALTPIINNVLYSMGSGTINFYTTNPSNPFFTVDFSGGTFLNPLNASASELSANVVNFTGPNVPTNLANRQFAFSLTNPSQNGTHVTYTSSFTSSADVVPEPASLIILGSAALALIRKRKA